MELNHLRHFYEVARNKSFSRAARALRISQPGVSRTVRLLEEHLDAPLIDRSGRGALRLTEAGDRLYLRCQRIFAELEHLEPDIRQIQNEVSGAVHFGVSDNLANYVLPALLRDFLAKHPKVSSHIYTGTSDAIAREILSDQIEFGLFYTKLRIREIGQSVLTRVPFCVVYSHRYLTLRNPTDLKRATYIGSHQNEYQKPYPALAMLHTIGVRNPKTIEVNSNEAQKQMAIAGLGYTVLPAFVVQKEIKSRELTMVPVSKPLESTIYLSKRNGRTLTRSATALLNTIRQELPSFVESFKR